MFLLNIFYTFFFHIYILDHLVQRLSLSWVPGCIAEGGGENQDETQIAPATIAVRIKHLLFLGDNFRSDV